MKKIPKKILDNIPIRYHFIDKIEFNVSEKNNILRTTTSKYYNSNEILCLPNYRKTSKLLDEI
jgi:hypothetical protein